MNPLSRAMIESPPTHLAFLQSDIVGSSLIQQEFGDAIHGQVIERVGRIYSECSRAFDGDYIDNAGDAPYGSFKTCRDAVRCALHFQDRLNDEQWPHGKPVEMRIGIHFGVVTCSIEDSASGRRKPVGEAVTVARRLVDLKAHGRIMISQTAADLAYEKDAPWLTWEHGRYGWHNGPTTYEQVVTVETAQTIRHPKFEVCEIVRPDEKPLVPSPSNPNACWPVDELWNRRDDKDTEPTQRIQPGMQVPGDTRWIIERLLGEGGFGQAWLARDASRSAPEYRVYKFCKNPARFRSFFREEGIDSHLKQSMTEKEKAQQLEKSGMDGIVPVLAFNKEPPLWVATPYLEKGSLIDWSLASPNDFRDFTPAERIRFIIELARILQRVHEAKVIHKDIKPANIFIRRDRHGIHPVIADFGISCVIDSERRQKYDQPGQHTLSSPISMIGTVRTGTDMFMPPEYQEAGAKPTVKGDIYALGILLYQLLISNFQKPWEGYQECNRRIPDLPVPDYSGSHLNPFIRKAILKALDAEDHRYASAEEFAQRLESLEEEYRNDVATKERQRYQRQRTIMSLSAAAVIVLAGLSFWALRNEKAAKHAALSEQVARHGAERAAEALKIQRDANETLVDDRGLALRQKTQGTGFNAAPSDMKILLPHVLEAADAVPTSDTQQRRVQAQRLMRLCEWLGDSDEALGSYDAALKRLSAFYQDSPKDETIRAAYLDALFLSRRWAHTWIEKADQFKAGDTAFSDPAELVKQCRVRVTAWSNEAIKVATEAASSKSDAYVVLHDALAHFSKVLLLAGGERVKPRSSLPEPSSFSWTAKVG